MPLIAEDVPFLPSRIIVLSELAKKEKEKYLSILLQSKAKFHQDGFGNYIANIRMLAPGVKRAALNPPRSPAVTRRSNRGVPIEEALRRLNSNEPVHVEFVDCAPFEYTGFPRFVRLCMVDGPINYRTRGLGWLMKTVEDLYDARYTQDTTEGQTQTDETRGDNVFPVFVYRFLANRLGLKGLVDQTCWDMLGTIAQLRSHHLEVEIFARFLQEFYDHDDLLFFLYVRSAIQKLLAITFKARWASSDTKNRQQGNQLWMTYRECLHVAKTVFGSEDDPMCAEFLAMVESHIVGRKDNGKDSRRIEVMEFMHLAVVGYHHARPDEDTTVTSSLRNERSAPQHYQTKHASTPATSADLTTTPRPRTPQTVQYHQPAAPQPQVNREPSSAPAKFFFTGDDADSPGALDDFLASLQRDRLALEQMQQQFGQAADDFGEGGEGGDDDAYYDEYKQYSEQTFAGQPQSLANYLSGSSYPDMPGAYSMGNEPEFLYSLDVGVNRQTPSQKGAEFAPKGADEGEDGEGGFEQRYGVGDGIGDDYYAYQEQLKNEALDYERFASNLYKDTPHVQRNDDGGDNGDNGAEAGFGNHEMDPETEMLIQMGQEIAYEEMGGFLDELLSSSDTAVRLPDEVLNEVREEMQIALEEKVNVMLDGLPPMEPSAFQQTIVSILGSEEVQNEMLSLMTLLLTYATQTLQEDSNAQGNADGNAEDNPADHSGDRAEANEG